MRIPERSRLADYIFLTRPTLLVPVWTLLLIGYYRGLVHSGSAMMRFTLEPRLLYVFLTYSALMGGVYILNQIVDRETDRRNEKLFLLSAGIVPLRFAVAEMVLLFVAPLFFSLLIDTHYFVLFVVSLVMGVMYSVRPIRMKGRPILDLVFNALGYGMVNFLVGWTIMGPPGRAAFVHAIPYCLADSLVYLYR